MAVWQSEGDLWRKRSVWAPLHPRLWQSEQRACRHDSELPTWSRLCQNPPVQSGAIWPSLKSTLSLNYSAYRSFLAILSLNTKITLNKREANFLNSSLSIAAFFRLTERPCREHTCVNHRAPSVSTHMSPTLILLTLSLTSIRSNHCPGPNYHLKAQRQDNQSCQGGGEWLAVTHL